MGRSRARNLATAIGIVVAALLLWPVVASANIYWANSGNGAIGTDTLDGDSSNIKEALISTGSTSTPAGVAVDGKFVYWSDQTGNTIGRANLDGSNPNPSFITAHVSNPEGMAIGGGFIYWANAGTGTITRDTLDGAPANVVDVVTGQSSPGYVATDGGHIYWSMGAGQTGSTIGRANLDGSSPNPNFIVGQNRPVGVAVTPQFIYWTNRGSGANGSIMRDTIDGNANNVVPLVTALGEPWGLDLAGGHIYWSSQIGNAIGVTNLDGSSPNADFINTGNAAPLQVAIDHPPANIAPPAISGSTVAAQTLAAANGSWTMNPTSFSHQWLRCDPSGSDCSAIPSATSQSYVLGPADVGSTVRVQEVAANALGGSGDPALSAPSSVVQNPPPPPPPPAERVVSVASSGLAESLTLACDGVGGQQCSGTVVGTVRERKRGASILAVTASKRSKHRGRAKTKTVTVTVSRGAFTVPAGQTATVRLTLNAAGKRLRARFGRLPVKLSLTGSTSVTRSIAFALPLVQVSTPPDHWTHILLPCGDCYTTAATVPITGLPSGAHVSVSCHGGGCSFGRRSVAPHERRVDLAAVLGGSHLQPGTTVDVAISARNRVGEVVRYTIQRGVGPLRTTLCLPPAASRPGFCP